MGNSTWRPQEAAAEQQRARPAAAAAKEEKKERRLPAAKRRQLEAREDAEDFAAEYRMLKKVKKGRMSEVGHFCFRCTTWLSYVRTAAASKPRERECGCAPWMCSQLQGQC